MTERDLKSLKNSAVPPHRAEAKRAAIEAALAVFDRDTDRRDNPDQTAEVQSTQGNDVSLRLTRTINRRRSSFMPTSSRQSLAIAASLAALIVVAPIAFSSWRDGTSRLATWSPEKPHATVAHESPTTAVRMPEQTASNSSRSEDRDVKNITVKPVASTLAGETDQDRATGQVSATTADVPTSVFASKMAVAPSAPAPPPAQDVQASTQSAEPDALGGSVKQDNLAAALVPSPVPENQAIRSRLDGVPSNLVDTRSEEERAGPLEYKDHDIFSAPEINAIKQVASEPVSTFSFDVDTASYSFLRRALNAGHLPPKQAVRVEELINYFPYSYPAPETAEVPFKPTVTMMPCPWKATDKLVHIAIKGYDLKRAERPRANLVFLLDTSGSMEGDDRLPLVKNALHLLVDQLQPDDTVGIVTYASGSGIALEPTKISDKGKILAAIDKLEAGGSTDGADGIADAYRLAEAGFDKKAVNRIVLATDGDFNVGITDRDQLKSFIERKRQSGIYLSILGVGEGNHNDALMQALAQNGNGAAAYVDTLNEARKVLVDEASSTLFPIAKDVKAQVEWNPARVSEYRLIGYESRALKREDFNNDQVDAGDVGSGHTVTAIYQVTPVGAPRLVDDLRYGKGQTERADAGSKPESSEFGFLKLRFKKPGSDTSDLISLPITDTLTKSSTDDVPADVRFSVAVAAFGDLVRGAPFIAGYTYDKVLELAQTARGDDPYGYRAEFLNLVRLAKSARP